MKAAWLARGFRHPPAGTADDETSQRAVLYQVLDARPGDLAHWIAEAPAKARAAEIVAHVLARWHEVRNEVGDDEMPWFEEPSRTEAAETLGTIVERLR